MRLRELYETINLFEAYDTKVAKLHKEFSQLRAGFPEKPETQWGPAEPAIPGDDTVPDEPQLAALVRFAEQAFKSGANPSEQAMQWYLTLLETYYKQNDPKYTGKFAAMIGDHRFTDFSSLNTELAHFFTSEYADSQYIKDIVKAIRPATTQVDNLITNAQAAEQRIHTENEEARKLAGRPDIELLEGDSVLLPSGNYSWWRLPYQSHEPESKAMGHCGRCQGSENNLLSLRTNKKPIWPVLTFEWNPNDNTLSQMKGPSNSKPGKSFHPHILNLLLSEFVQGISQQSYQPANDFSVFDLPPASIDQLIAAGKENLVTDQIIKYPIAFLRAPHAIRANPKFRNVAFSYQPGLRALINEDGSVDESQEKWEEAIDQNPKIIIYAPDSIDDWENRVTSYLTDHIQDLGNCSGKIRGNYNIMSTLIGIHQAAIELVPLRAEAYDKLALQAVTQAGYLLKAIPIERRTFELCMVALDFLKTYHYQMSPEEMFELIEIKRFTKDEQRQLADKFQEFDKSGVVFEYLSDKEKTPERLDSLVRTVRLNYELSDEARAARLTTIFRNTPKENFTKEQYMDFCIQIARVAPTAIPLEMQDYDFVRTHIIWMNGSEENVDAVLNSPAYNALSDDDQRRIDLQLARITDTGLSKVSHNFEHDPLAYLRVIDALYLTPEKLELVINWVEKNMPAIEKDGHLSRRLVGIFSKVVDNGTGVLANLPMPSNTSESDYKDIIDIMKPGMCENLIGVPDWVVANNKKWYMKAVIKSMTHDNAKGVDDLYQGIANYTNAEEMYLEIYENFDDYMQEIVGNLSIDSLVKTRFLYDIDPEPMRDAFAYKLQKTPGIIDEATVAFPKIFTEDDADWMQAYFREAFNKYFRSGGSDTIFNKMNLNVISPFVLKFAVESSVRRLHPEINDSLQRVYRWAKDKPAYAEVVRYIEQEFTTGLPYGIDDEEVNDDNTYDFIDPRDQ